MPTFDTPPDWWVSLSNLTQWLHWPAISAVVAGAAWWRTGSLADQARRESRRSDAAFYVALAVLLEGALEPYRGGFVSYKNGVELKRAVRNVEKVAAAVDYEKRLKDVKLTDFPTPNGLAIFLVAEARLHSVKIMTLNIAQLGHDDSEPWGEAIREVERSVLNLVAEARSLTKHEIPFDEDTFADVRIVATSNAEPSVDENTLQHPPLPA